MASRSRINTRFWTNQIFDLDAALLILKISRLRLTQVSEWNDRTKWGIVFIGATSLARKVE